MSLFLEPKSEFAKSKHRTHVEMTELEIHIAIEDDGLFFESYYIDSLYAKALVHKSSMLYALNKVSDEILRKAYLYDQEAVLEET
jgi:hypothetical protein